MLDVLYCYDVCTPVLLRYVLVGLTGRDQDICVVSFQLSSELLFTAVYPRTGGVSGNCSKNMPKPILKLSRAFRCETSDGNMFQS